MLFTFFVSGINCFSLQRIDIHPAFIFEPLFIVISIHMSQGMDDSTNLQSAIPATPQDFKKVKQDGEAQLKIFMDE